MVPVSDRAERQFLPAFHEQHARVADLAGARAVVHAEALREVRLVALAVGEARARRLRATDAAAADAAVDLRLVEAEHRVCRNTQRNIRYSQQVVFVHRTTHNLARNK